MNNEKLKDQESDSAFLDAHSAGETYLRRLGYDPDIVEEEEEEDEKEEEEPEIVEYRTEDILTDLNKRAELLNDEHAAKLRDEILRTANAENIELEWKK